MSIPTKLLAKSTAVGASSLVKGPSRSEVGYRQAFTLVEMLVSMALILFIMVILSTAFTTGLGVFRQLKGLGDMEERLRSTSQILKRDLSAYHFENYRKLSDADFWDDQPPQQGFFRIWQGSRSILEGKDVDDTPAVTLGDGTTIPATISRSLRSTTHMLHFTSKLTGQGQGDFATSDAWSFLNDLSLPGPAPSALGVMTAATLSKGGDGRFQAPYVRQIAPPIPPFFQQPVSYRSRWYQVAYFMHYNGMSTGANGVPLYTLYRRQLGILEPGNLPTGIPFTPALWKDLSEFACQTNGSAITFEQPTDLVFPSNRFAMSATSAVGIPSATFFDPIVGSNISTYPSLGQPSPQVSWQDNADLQGADVLLSDVISFDVSVSTVSNSEGFFNLLPDSTTSLPNFSTNNSQFNNALGPFVFDSWTSGNNGTTDFSGWKEAGPTAVPLKISISAIRVTIRVWDAKTQQARQITIIQDM
jgi:prepilin-type N-terminal cleavage/methylation domain-containing protein